MVDEAFESGEPVKVTPKTEETQKKSEVDSQVARFRAAMIPGRALLEINDYREKRHLTNFFSLTEAKDLIPDFQLLTSPVEEATITDETILKAQTATVAIGLELATQLQEPRKILAAKEDGKAGFDEMERPYATMSNLTRDLKEKQPDVYLRELKRVAARRGGLSPVQIDQVSETEAFRFEKNLTLSQNLIRHKAEAMRAYSRR